MGFLRAPSHFVPSKSTRHGNGMRRARRAFNYRLHFNSGARIIEIVWARTHTHTQMLRMQKKNRFTFKLELIECHRQLHIPSHRHIQKERRTHTHTPKHVYWIFMKYEYFPHTRYVMTRSDTTCAWISDIRLFCAVWNQSKWNASWKVCLDETEWITTSTHTKSML